MRIPEALEELEKMRQRSPGMDIFRKEAKAILDAVRAQAYDEGRALMFEITPPVINYVIEASASGKPWFTWWHIATGDDNENWRRWLPVAQHRENLRFQLVKRTAFIHDKILDTDNPEE